MFETLVEFLRTCPGLENAEANFLGENPGEVSIQAAPCNPVLYRYTDGDSLRQFVFTVCSRESVLPKDRMTPEKFYETVAFWLESHLPVLQDGKAAQRFEVIDTAAIAERDYTGLRYELTCRLVYYQKGE